MTNEYTGLHGRVPWESPHLAWRGKEEEHAAPEHWEDLDRGICPWCGRTVRWDPDASDSGMGAWVLDPSLTVIVLTEEEFKSLVYEPGPAKTIEMIERMYDLNRPYEEPDV